MKKPKKHKVYNIQKIEYLNEKQMYRVDLLIKAKSLNGRLRAKITYHEILELASEHEVKGDFLMLFFSKQFFENEFVKNFSVKVKAKEFVI